MKRVNTLMFLSDESKLLVPLIVRMETYKSIWQIRSCMPGARGLWIVFFTYIVDVFGQSVNSGRFCAEALPFYTETKEIFDSA